jgi:hypothetical protein
MKGLVAIVAASVLSVGLLIACGDKEGVVSNDPPTDVVECKQEDLKPGEVCP